MFVIYPPETGLYVSFSLSLQTTKPNEDNDDAISSTSTTKIIKSHVSRCVIYNIFREINLFFVKLQLSIIYFFPGLPSPIPERISVSILNI